MLITRQNLLRDLVLHAIAIERFGVRQPHIHLSIFIKSSQLYLQHKNLHP